MEINGQVVKEIRRVRDNAVIFSGGGSSDVSVIYSDDSIRDVYVKGDYLFMVQTKSIKVINLTNNSLMYKLIIDSSQLKIEMIDISKNVFIVTVYLSRGNTPKYILYNLSTGSKIATLNDYFEEGYRMRYSNGKLCGYYTSNNTSGNLYASFDAFTFKREKFNRAWSEIIERTLWHENGRFYGVSGDEIVEITFTSDYTDPPKISRRLFSIGDRSPYSSKTDIKIWYKNNDVFIIKGTSSLFCFSVSGQKIWEISTGTINFGDDAVELKNYSVVDFTDSLAYLNAYDGGQNKYASFRLPLKSGTPTRKNDFFERTEGKKYFVGRIYDYLTKGVVFISKSEKFLENNVLLR